VVVGCPVALHSAFNRAALSTSNRRCLAPRAPDPDHVGCHLWLKRSAARRDASSYARAGVAASKSLAIP
jgi:hypothetical protein